MEDTRTAGGESPLKRRPRSRAASHDCGEHPSRRGAVASEGVKALRIATAATSNLVDRRDPERLQLGGEHSAKIDARPSMTEINGAAAERAAADELVRHVVTNLETAPFDERANRGDQPFRTRPLAEGADTGRDSVLDGPAPAAMNSRNRAALRASNEHRSAVGDASSTGDSGRRRERDVPLALANGAVVLFAGQPRCHRAVHLGEQVEPFARHAKLDAGRLPIRADGAREKSVGETRLGKTCAQKDDWCHGASMSLWTVHMLASPGVAMHPQDPYIGREILNGQFKILKKIGTGGMGSVYKALQPDMNRMVAVKILHAKLKTRKDLVSRFRREARAMSHLTHPNTVKVMMYGTLEDGELYILMEYLEGKNLNQVVRREGPLEVERAVSVLMQVCGALEEAHQLGIVHRDLKPENIFLTNSGGLTDFAKVLDFGLAKVTERELRPGSIMLTQEGMVFGTPEFMSPEQAQGVTLDRRSDIYSLAVILYEALTGKLPFDARSSMEFIQLHVSRPPILLDLRLPDKTFPAGLGDVLARALSKEPTDRHASAAAFAECLRPYAPHGFLVDIPVPQVNTSEAPPHSVGPDSAPGIHSGRAPSESEAATAPRRADDFIDTMEEPIELPTGTPIRSQTLVLVAVISLLLGILATFAAVKLHFVG